MIEIDGSRGEGGGQVLRTALALSAALGQPFRMVKVRARRKRTGLAAQHLAAVRMVAAICAADVEGAEVGSAELTFRPREVRPGSYAQNVGTAGATTLVAQAALLPLLRAEEASDLTITGGTHVSWSPPFEFLQRVYAPVLGWLGWDARFALERRGFYPRGGGEIKVHLTGRPDASPTVSPTRWRRPPREKMHIDVLAVVSSLSRTIAERMLHTVANGLASRGWQAHQELLEVPGPTGTYVFIHVHGPAIAGGFTGLGAPGKPAERVAIEALGDAIRFLDSDAAVDARLADQVLLPAIMTGRDLTFTTRRISQHLRTQADTIAAFLGPRVTFQESGEVVIGSDRNSNSKLI